MGYLWHDRPVDHGIDGEIELVSPDGTPLNIAVMVQGKARGRPFAYERSERSAGGKQVNLWMSGLLEQGFTMVQTGSELPGPAHGWLLQPAPNAGRLLAPDDTVAYEGGLTQPE